MDSDNRDETIRLWREDDAGVRQLTEIRRSMFASEDAFQEALQFHLERGCELEER